MTRKAHARQARGRRATVHATVITNPISTAAMANPMAAVVWPLDTSKPTKLGSTTRAQETRRNWPRRPGAEFPDGAQYQIT